MKICSMTGAQGAVVSIEEWLLAGKPSLCQLCSLRYNQQLINRQPEAPGSAGGAAGLGSAVATKVEENTPGQPLRILLGAEVRGGHHTFDGLQRTL